METIARPSTRDVLRFCYFGDEQRKLVDRAAAFAAWCVTLAVLVFNALFRVLFEDGNLLIRGVCTVVLSLPLALLYARGKRAVLARRAA